MKSKSMLLGIWGLAALGCGDSVPKLVPDMTVPVTVQESGEVPVCDRPDLDSAGIKIDYYKELMITAADVVYDPCRTTWAYSLNCDKDKERGHWTFGYLMEQMAGDQPVETFMKDWISTWASAQTVKMDGIVPVSVQPRASISIIQNSPWAAGGYKKELAPFRLMAIVNRVDLARDPGSTSGYPASMGSLGEGRFVFAFVGPDGKPLQASVILEYSLPPIPPTLNATAWALEWHQLNTLSGDAYKKKLQSLTDRFANRNLSLITANNSAINSVRTNEVAFDGSGANQWELRSFSLLNPASGTASCQGPCGLNLEPLSNTPDAAHNNTQLLSDWIYGNNNYKSVLQQTHNLPGTIFSSGTYKQLKAAAFRIFGPIPTNIWRFPVKTTVDADPYDLQQRFAFLTCDGCHYSETDTKNLQIRPGMNTTAELSEFLRLRDLRDCRAQTVVDPRGPSTTGIVRGFNEPRRRACEMVRLLKGSPIRYSPLNNSVRLDSNDPCLTRH